MEINEILQGTDKTILMLSRTDLLEFAKTIADDCKATLYKEKTQQELEQPISQQEAIKFLGKSRQTLNAWRKKGLIEAHPLGGRLYFFRSELLAALNKRV